MGKDRLKNVKLSVQANGKTVGKPILFRVKNVPDPTPMIGDIEGTGTMTKSNLLGAYGVIAKMKDFEFDLRFKVLSYTMSYMGSGSEVVVRVTGNKFDAQAEKAIKSAKRGQTITFKDIKVQLDAPGSKPKNIKSIIQVKIK